MASYYFDKTPVQRSKGQNAVAKAAYISASKLVYKTIDKESGEEISITYDFSKKQGVVYSKIFVPEEFKDVAWLQDREQLWNAAEARERREDSRPAEQVCFALPKEVSREENIKVVEEYVNKHLVARGIVCDVNIHYDNPDNPHVHIQHLTRRLESLENGAVILSKVKARELFTTKAMYDFREQCEVEINKIYEEAGLPFRVTAKSYKALGIDQEPTRHKGPAHYMKATELEAKNKEIIAENAKKIYESPEIVFGRISYTKPVFSKEDIAIALSDALMVHLVSKGKEVTQEQEAIRAFGSSLLESQDSNSTAVGSSGIGNNPAIEHLNKEYGEEFLRLYNRLLLSDAIELMDQKDLMGRTLYSLKSRVNLERRYVSAIEELNAGEGHNLNISSNNLERRSLKEQIGDLVNVVGANLQNKFNDKIGSSLGLKLNVFGSKNHEFSTEQINAILSVCNGSDISVLEGNPGAGKTFVIREIVRQYKSAGFKVVGTGPSSVSAKVLSRNAGIKADNTSLLRKKIEGSRGSEFKIDLSSKYYEEEEYLRSIGCDAVFGSSGVLDSKSVLIVDEASMIELANMDYLAHEVLRSKAKLVLVGDNNQFPAIGITGAFNKARKIARGVKLTEVRRQERLKYRQATELMGRFAMHEAIKIYKKLDVFNIKDNEEEAKTSLVISFAKEYTEQMESLKRDDLIAMRSIAIGAYSNERVSEFNRRVREELKNSGALKGSEAVINSGGRMLPLMKGEQVVFEENSLRYGISNGEVGTILSVKPVDSSVDGQGEGVLKILVHKADGSKDIINIDTASDAANNKRRIKLNHGYALTGYKLQGETVERMHVYFDRSIGYEAFLVLMSRHREEVKLHASARELEDIIYQRLDSESDKVRERFKIDSYEMVSETKTNEKGKSYETHVAKEIPNWLIGLTLAVSRRANNSFAIDYKSNGLLDGNQLIIKEYLEARVRVFECHGKMREWKNDIESLGNITRLHRNIELAAKAFNMELELNIKDLKIDPYSIVFADGRDSFKYVIENILKGKKEEHTESDKQENKGIKGVSYNDDKVKIKFRELDNSDQSKIIAICLSENDYENLKEIFEELKLEKGVLNNYAGVICDSYSSVIDAGDAAKFKHLILDKRAARKLIVENQAELRFLTREKNFSKSEEYKDKLEEQIEEIKEQRAEYDEKLERIFSNMLSLIQLVKKRTELTSSSVLMGERTVQLNINYETVQKHAGLAPYKYYLKDISLKTSISNCKAYQDLMGIVRDVSGDILTERELAIHNLSGKQVVDQKFTTNLVSRLEKSLSGIDSFVFDNQELIELKRSDLLESQKNLSSLKQEEQAKRSFVGTLFPHYLGRIYEEKGEEIIEKWEAIKVSNHGVGIRELISQVRSNPSMLGKLRGIGIGTILGVSTSRRKAIEQVPNLGKQLLKYEEDIARLNEIEHNNLIKEQEQKVVVLTEELSVLESQEASKAEEKFLSSLKAMQAGSGLNTDSFKSLVLSDEVQDLLYEYYNNQNERYIRINELEEEGEKELAVEEELKEPEINIDKDVKDRGSAEATTVSSTKTRKGNRNSTKGSVLRFDKVQDALTSSDIERIFRQYAGGIRGGISHIKRSGSEISMGSLSMHLNKGTWIRHSSGASGNIFGFVQEGAGVSKRQSLEIVAELAGIRAESSSYDFDFTSRRVKQERELEQVKHKANEWVAAQSKITNAESFDPSRHLKGMVQHNKLEAVYSYKDAEDKLLGYVVRFVSKEDGKKQTLPVTYCYNGAKGEYSWRLKGFTDKGDKPIYGIEKAISSGRPILIVEGEKAANAASKVLPEYNVVSWMGGSNAADKVNWSQLKGSDVIIWPDNDEPGFKAAEVIKNKLNKANHHIGFVSIVDPNRLKFGDTIHKDLLPEKWDLADRLPAGMTIENIKEAIKNVRSAHLDMNHIQSVIQSIPQELNAAVDKAVCIDQEALQKTFERNIWQEVFKGKMVNEAKIKELSINEQNVAAFFKSEESSSYIKYLEATGKGGVSHDYLKYDSLMYQDMLTSLAVRDTGLSSKIYGLNKSSQDQAIDDRLQLINDAQNIYEKKALEYGGIAGTNEVYRDYLELMVKSFGESHEKVALYKNVVRDISILHSAQLGMNINDLPDNHHTKIAQDVYSAISEWSNRYKLDASDKNKIANQIYDEYCSIGSWKQKSYEQVATGYKVYADYQRRLEQTRLADIESESERKKLISHTEQIRNELLISKTVSDVFVALEEDEKFFIAVHGNIKYTTFNYKFEKLAQQALEHREQQLLLKLREVAEAVEQHGVFSTHEILDKLKSSENLEETYKHFDSNLERHQLEAQHQVIKHDKEHAKTTEEMLTAISREHEFFKSLDGNLKYTEQYDSSLLSSISNAKSMEQDTLITNMHNMVLYAQKHDILEDQDILNQFNSSDSHNVLKNLSKICEKHYMDHHNENIKQLLDDEHVMVGDKKYTNPLKYMKHEMQNNIPGFVDKEQISATFTKVKAEFKELRLEKELDYTMTMRL